LDIAVRHPGIGETVGDYKVVAQLGAGGLGVVYKVERGGRFFALKWLLGPMDGRTRREIRILVHLENPGVVRYVGSDFWPHPALGHPYIVMEYVPGDTLEAFALKHNPSSRQCVRIILDVARTLGEVHGAGVFHRDLKPTNILIRETSERPVLIDFGIATLGGAVCLTETRLPPATEEFRAPEPLRFWRENTDDTARYEHTITDELWALGVTFYWLLTDVYPFGDRTDEGAIAGLRERILTRRPIAPHLLNPRVPLAVSRLCMKMLAEWPGDRFPEVTQLCMVFNEALTQAEGDTTWDVSLVDPYDPQVTTTLEDPERREPDELRRSLLKWTKSRPRRGLVRPNKAPDSPPPPSQVEQPRPPIPEAEQDRTPTVSAEPPPASTPREARLSGGHEPPATSVPAWTHFMRASSAAQLSRAPWRLGLAAAVMTLAVVGLYMSVGLWGSGASSRNGKGQPEAMRPSTSPPDGSTIDSVAGHEVAPTSKPLESLPGEGAAPVGAPLPAPTTNAMLRTPAQTKRSETQTQRAGLHLSVKSATVAAAVAACSLLEGCAGSTTQVRTGPAPVTCPTGWQQTHAKFHLGGTAEVVLAGYKGEAGEELATVKEGPVTVVLDEGWDKLPPGTLLTGTLTVGEKRFFGRFTRAQPPDRQTYPVCIQVYNPGEDVNRGGQICREGVGYCLLPSSKPDAFKVFPRLDVQATNRFE
jgi:serine/threonine protein kinase